MDFKFEDNYKVNSKYNDGILDVAYISSVVEGLDYGATDFEKLGLDVSNFNKIQKTIDKYEIDGNKLKRLDKWFNEHKDMNVKSFFTINENYMPKQKSDFEYYASEYYSVELFTILSTNNVEIEIVDTPKPILKSDWIAYDNKDLKSLTERAIVEYFYDFPICLESVQFLPNGGKGNTLGYCSAWGKKAKFVQNEDMIYKDNVFFIRLFPQLKGFDIKEVLLHEICHMVDALLHGWNGSEGDSETKGHGKGFMEVADIINKRADVSIGQYSSEYEGDLFNLSSKIYNYIKGREDFLHTFFMKNYYSSVGQDLEILENMECNFVYDLDKSPNHELYNLWWTYMFKNNEKYRFSDISAYIKENDLTIYLYNK